MIVAGDKLQANYICPYSLDRSIFNRPKYCHLASKKKDEVKMALHGCGTCMTYHMAD